jgi:hypothetical protein
MGLRRKLIRRIMSRSSFLCHYWPNRPVDTKRTPETQMEVISRKTQAGETGTRATMVAKSVTQKERRRSSKGSRVQ